MPTFQGMAQQGGVPNVPRAIPVVRGYNNGNGPVFEYPYSISGVTKDSTGAALTSCNVHLFRTADDSFVHQTVSNGNGSYIIPASKELQHYLVAYKPGSPDVAGTSVNTLVGA